MTTVSDLVEETRRHLYSLHQGKYNFLTATINDAATTLQCDLTMGGIVAGALLAIDSEIVYVKSVAGQVATVHRGWEDTTAASHTAGAMIEVGPRFPGYAIKKALQQEIRSWPRTMFKKTLATSISGSATSRAYDLTTIGTSWYNITEVRYGPTTDGTYPRVKSYDVDRGRNYLYLPRTLDSDYDLSVDYTGPFVTSTFEDATDIEATVGLSASMLDIPIYGAAWRLLAPREVKRTFTESQSEPRHSNEVPVGSALRTAAGLKTLRDQRIVEEGDRLAATVAVRW